MTGTTSTLAHSAPRKRLKFIKDEVEYYPHQTEGVRQLARMRSFLLADDMGLGKSLQALTVVAIDFELGHAKKFLVVCPATLKGNWEEEIREHTNFSCEILDGTPTQREKQLNDFNKHCLIVNYEQVEPHLSMLNSMGFDIVVYDEAHYIKNHKANRTKAAQGLESKRHFLLTGSPMLGHVNDLWSLLYRINPDMENYWRFINRYCVFGGFKDKQIVGVKNRDELQERLQTFMVRRRKVDVLDLPEKQYIKIKVDLGPLQRELYDEVIEDMRLSAPPASTASPMEIENALARFTRLKQICGTPAAITFSDEDDVPAEPYPDESPKLDRVIEMAEEIVKEDGEHLVMFTQSRGVLKALNSRLGKKKISVNSLHGGVPIGDRQYVVSEWRDSKPGVMLAMLQVAGVGLNMTAARKCIMVDKLFVPALMRQAEDRLHRIGADTTQPVQIYEMITRGTIESRVESILRTKSQLFEDVVETSDFKRKLYAALMEDDDE